MRQSLRLARLGLHLLHGVAIVGLLFPFMNAQLRRTAVQRWSRRLLRVLAVRLEVEGLATRSVGTPLFITANHVSWLDIFVINAVLPARFVAKSEVRSWPVIGWLSARAGTLYIRRGRRADLVATNDAVARALLAGDVVAVFPEGTTTRGTEVLPFHASLLQAAGAAGAAVLPVALRFERIDGGLCDEVAYVAERTVWDTLRAMVCQPAIRAYLVALPVLVDAGCHRRERAATARAAIRRALFLRAPDSRTASAVDPPVAGH